MLYLQPGQQCGGSPAAAGQETLFDLEDNLLLFFTGISRSAGSVLKDQDQRTKSADDQMISNLHYVKLIFDS
jgi:D-glycero-alpha-D-manno-heptose-7-phosphate kinase